MLALYIFIYLYILIYVVSIPLKRLIDRAITTSSELCINTKRISLQFLKRDTSRIVVFQMWTPNEVLSIQIGFFAVNNPVT